MLSSTIENESKIKTLKKLDAEIKRVLIETKDLDCTKYPFLGEHPVSFPSDSDTFDWSEDKGE